MNYIQIFLFCKFLNEIYKQIFEICLILDSRYNILYTYFR